MSYTVVIPARYASTRLPGKPLLDLGGKPMVQRVYEQVLKASPRRIIIATDSEEIAKTASSFGAEVCMTSMDHYSGTERVQEVVEREDLPQSEIVVNVQGDEPLIPPAVIDQVAANLQNHSEAGIATLCEPIDTLEMLLDPSIVKVVSDNKGMALYFSRAPIPWPRDEFANQKKSLPSETCWFRHLGVYAYKVEFLNSYIKWPLSKIERIEKLEQLRALANGINIHVAQAIEPVPGGIDTVADLERINELFARET